MTGVRELFLAILISSSIFVFALELNNQVSCRKFLIFRLFSQQKSNLGSMLTSLMHFMNEFLLIPPMTSSGKYMRFVKFMSSLFSEIWAFLSSLEWQNNLDLSLHPEQNRWVISWQNEIISCVIHISQILDYDMIIPIIETKIDHQEDQKVNINQMIIGVCLVYRNTKLQQYSWLRSFNYYPHHVTKSINLLRKIRFIERERLKETIQ